MPTTIMVTAPAIVQTKGKGHETENVNTIITGQEKGQHLPSRRAVTPIAIPRHTAVIDTKRVATRN